jgi:WD40 repeat protein
MLLAGAGAPPLLVTPDLRVVALPLRDSDGPLSPDGAQILGVREGALRVLDLHTGRVLATLEGSGAAAERLAFSASGRYVAGFVARSLRIWATETGALHASAVDARSCALGPGDWTGPACVCADVQSR